MDGNKTTQEDLITTNVKWPNGISLDLVQKKMYWTEAKLDRIETANLDGSDRKTLKTGDLIYHGIVFVSILGLFGKIRQPDNIYRKKTN